MVTLEPPELVRVSGRLWLLLTCTLPKLNEVEFAVSDPCVTPLPESATAKVGFDALLAIEILPVVDVAAWGAKATLKLTLCPGARATGRLNPLIVKLEPETFTWLMVTLDPPELVSVSGK